MKIDLVKINNRISKAIRKYIQNYYKKDRIVPYLKEDVLDFITKCRYASDDVRPLLTLLGYEIAGGKYNFEYILPAMSAIHLCLLGFIPIDDIIDGLERQKNFTFNDIPAKLSLAYSLSTKLREDARMIFQTNYGNLPCFGRINTLISQCLQKLDGSHTLETNYHSKVPFSKYSINEYFKLIDEATSILIANSFVIGGLIAGINKKTEQDMYEFGMDLGRLCQIRDDFLDYIDPRVTGKLPFSDLYSRKKRFPVLLILWYGDEIQKRTVVKILEKDMVVKTDICQVLEMILDKKIKEQSLKIITDIRNRALQRLKSLPKIQPAYNILREITLLYSV